MPREPDCAVPSVAVTTLQRQDCSVTCPDRIVRDPAEPDSAERSGCVKLKLDWNERQRSAADDQRHSWWQAQPVRDVVQGDDREQHRDH